MENYRSISTLPEGTGRIFNLAFALKEVLMKTGMADLSYVTNERVMRLFGETNVF